MRLLRMRSETLLSNVLESVGTSERLMADIKALLESEVGATRRYCHE
jgi:hypothetical protein